MTLLCAPRGPCAARCDGTWRIVLFWGLVLSGAMGADAGSPAVDRYDADYRQAVQADWALQEQRAGRSAADPAALREIVRRGEQLLESLALLANAPAPADAHTALSRARLAVEQAEHLTEPERIKLYQELRWMVREWSLANPLLANRQIVFLQRRRFICQMLHEYIGYYYNYADLAGGGVFVLEEPGRSFRTRDLLSGRLPRGAYATIALSPHGQTVYFAFCEVQDVERNHRTGHNWTVLPPADQVPDELNYYSPDRAAFHLYRVDVDGQNLKQLTFGCEDDFDPCPVSEDRLIFMSSRRGGFCRCDNPFEPIPTHTLHALDLPTGAVETLSCHETNEWHPSPLRDGRIVYCRWDYVDRSAAHFHGLWTSNPDGSNPAILFGNYTKELSACYQPRAVPNSHKIVFVAGAHHANVGGSLVLLDPTRVRLDPISGEDVFDSLERLTPEVCFPETSEGWCDSFFHSPWPLSEDHYLVAFSFERLPGMGSTMRDDAETGLYYFDRFGNLELLFRRAGVCSVGAIPLAPRAAPPQLPPIASDIGVDEGEFILADVNWSHLPLPPDRPIRQLRVFQVLPKETTHVANLPRIGVANAEPARMFLGTVPVEPDGSAYFRVPANRPLYFQAVDETGRAVQSMRSVTYVQPGERRGCIGCHETPGSVAPNRPLLALRRPPSVLEEGPDGSRPLSYPRLVQSVLDRHCVRCHDPARGPDTHEPDLTGHPAGAFTNSYQSLRPYIRWYEWGDESITQTVTFPGRGGADESPLLTILGDADHRAQLRLSDEDVSRLVLWLDANAPFYGTYQDSAQSRQLAGESVPPPAAQ
jgi:hypothetical protein